MWTSEPLKDAEVWKMLSETLYTLKYNILVVMIESRMTICGCACFLYLYPPIIWTVSYKLHACRFSPFNSKYLNLLLN